MAARTSLLVVVALVAACLALAASVRSGRPSRSVPTDVERGREIWSARRCGACHGLAADGGLAAGDLDHTEPRRGAVSLRHLLLRGSHTTFAPDLSAREVDALVVLLQAVAAAEPER